MYFEKFPTSLYYPNINETMLVTDWVRAIRIPDEILNDDNLYDYYMVRDGETPEIISHKKYRSTMYHWVIMLINKKYDLWNDYPKSDSAIRQNCIEKYDDPDGVHHYVNDQGKVVDEFTYPRIPVSNYEYETEENESKRMIKVLRPEFLSEFVSIFSEIIGDENV